MSTAAVIQRVRRSQERLRSQKTQLNDMDRVKRQLHSELVEALDFERLGQTPREELAGQLRSVLTMQVEARSLPLNRVEREQLVDEILDEVLGLGPLEPLLRDDSVTDILINGPDQVWVERSGVLEELDVRFQSNEHLQQIIDRIVGAVGRRIDETSPMVDARLADGSRVNAIIPPLALDGPMVSIRRFRNDPITAADLVRFGSVPQEVMEVLQGCVRAKLNVLISGGTGSGKTTLLNVMSSFIPPGERVVTIEDSAELRLQQRHVVRLETRPPNLEGRGEVTQRELVKNALRMRPDRIILGEIRGAEAVDMLQAMNTGHEGSLGTVHSNSARDALSRLETMIGMGMPNLDDRHIRETIARSLDLVVHLDRLVDGSRRLMSVTEVVGMEGPVVTTQDIFRFDQSTVDSEGRVRGAYVATGTRPRFSDSLARYGVKLDRELFTLRKEV
jgi:pilus assembly protein CpaF